MQHESRASRPDPCETGTVVLVAKALSGVAGPYVGFRLCLLAVASSPRLMAVFLFFPRDISESYNVCAVFGSS